MAKIKAYAIKNQWINFSLYFVNFMYKTKRNPSRSKICSWILPYKDRLKSNQNPIGAGQTDTQFLGNGNHYRTDFIEIDKDDLVNVFFTNQINNLQQYGMRLSKTQLKGTTYKRSATNTGSEPANINQETSGNDMTQYYFLKGVFNNEIITYLIESKII
jgi:hypothetical protein